MSIRCACGNVASANETECPTCYLERLRGVNWHYAPTRSQGHAIDPDKQKKWDRDLEEYRKVRSEGSQPQSTNRPDVETAKRLSDAQGQPFRAVGS